MPCLVKAAVLQHRNLRKIRKKIEVEKSGLEDKIKIGSLSTIQLETERHIVEIFGSRSSVGVDLHHMRGPKGGGKYTEAIVQSLRNNGLSI